MKLFKYLLFIALFAGITLPLLTSCSNDDDEASPIEGYWYERDDEEEPSTSYSMWLIKNGKYVFVYTYKSYITKSELKECVDEAFRSNKDSNSSVYIGDKGTYTLKGKKLKVTDSTDGDVDYLYVSFQKSNSVMVWEDEDHDEEGRIYLQRYTEE